jgi:hypothetical protein
MQDIMDGNGLDPESLLGAIGSVCLFETPTAGIPAATKFEYVYTLGKAECNMFDTYSTMTTAVDMDQTNQIMKASGGVSAGKVSEGGTDPFAESDWSDWVYNIAYHPIAGNRVMTGARIGGIVIAIPVNHSQIFLTPSGGLPKWVNGDYQKASCQMLDLEEDGSRTANINADVYNPDENNDVGAMIEIQAKIVNGRYVVDWEAC